MARASPTLKGVAHAFNRHNCSIAAAINSPYLLPAIFPDCSFSKRSHGTKYEGFRRHISVSASPLLTDNSVDGHIYKRRGLPLEVEALISSSRRLKPEPWATAIESYLPLNLRLGAKNVATDVAEEVIQYESLQPIHTLPEILSLARYFCKADLLSYIGVHQERWEAVIWLVKAMMEKYPGHGETESVSRQLPQVLWDPVNRKLDEITGNPIRVEMPQPSAPSREHRRSYGGFSLDKYPWVYESELREEPHILGRKSLGQIWQSLGVMILQAADHPGEHPSYSFIMSQVFRILGHLHRINALPDTIYNYASPTDPTVLQRPPTLYVQSKRIMSTLSDVEFVLQWEETVAKLLAQGYELPKASVQPKIREFGPELWLDLVLWACVEGGWVSEGAWILIEMQRRMASKDTRWKTISWPEICETKAPKVSWLSVLRLELEKTRLNQISGIGIATGTNSHIDMGTRTISREVVLALMDGLLSNPQSTAGGLGMTSVELRRSIIACKNLLDCNHSELDGNFMDAAILRIFESFEDVREQPGSLSRFLDLRPAEVKQATSKSGTKGSDQDNKIDDSAAVLGLYHRNLHRFSVDGNQDASLRTFRKIQSAIDTWREEKIMAFAHELKERLGKGEDVSDLIGDIEDDAALAQPAKVPLSALAPFVDLITDSRLFELGNWLLLNEDIDGGLVDPAVYSDQNLQPALLRFGTATSNSQLLTKVLVELETPMSEPIVHALLRFQVALGQWTAVQELLKYVEEARDMAWKPSDATAIAKAILLLEHKSSDTANDDSCLRALSILQNLVNGEYDSKVDPSQLIPDFTQARMANQLGRIFRTLPGRLSEIATRPRGQDLRAHASADITPNAFNIILETIVDLYGSLAGKKLWDQWCRVPNVRKREQHAHPSFGGAERVVTPTLYMLRSLLRPVLETRRALHAAMKVELIKTQKSKTVDAEQEDFNSVALNRKYRLGDGDQAILDWGIDMFKRFGMSGSDINNEIPGSFPQRQRAKSVQDED